ncbi:uncharacterized protein N0V89_002836 [Didymosphaeria variabile]|uniref:F-box domain-containing protein n=1 Tax=Didymosphaeria variabile TaxID=1932322 RepID=A0A9W8XT97_9PLEO|nr:uncharacterized protein N0V89_002836 [Didymosphaeria variabile]KAJ4358256.1 hypothetical protein N0V89_002836 [Didymosphaeria variabile]
MPTSHLPVEIHNIISSHLARDDILRYRSASKRLADIGAQYLFKSLVFHASYHSLGCIESIGYREHLRHFVETITWDTSSLGLDVLSFDEWKHRIGSLTPHQLWMLRETWERAQSSEHEDIGKCNNRFLRDQYERYRNLVAEGQEVQDLHLAELADLLAPFPRLTSIIVEKKRYHVANATSERLEIYSNEGLLKRSMLHHHRWMPYKHSTDMFPLVAALNAAQASACQLETRNINFHVFSQPNYMEHLQHIRVSQITRLDLRFALHDATFDPQESSMNIMNCKTVLRQGYLRDFLRKFVSLRSLSVDFGTRSLGNGRAPVNLQDVFSMDQRHSWPHLRELAIHHADTPSHTISALLSSHASSLRVLSLGDICLDPPASWESLFTSLQPTLSLSSAAFSYFLFDARIESFLRGRSAMLGWYCDNEECVEESSELGPRLEAFMVKGGVCPLSEERKVVRVVGRLDDGRVEDWVAGRRVSVVT